MTRTPEQEEAVRRRAVPVAVAGALLGLAGVLMPVKVVITPFSPPSILAINLAICAIMIGIGLIFYIKGTPRTGVALVLCLAAIAAGIGGTLVYTRQSIEFRRMREEVEKNNVEGIARAARTYAGEHGGAYPADLLVLIEESRIDPLMLQSPWGKRAPVLEHVPELTKQVADRGERLRTIETASDYLYVGGDLKNVPTDLAEKILVVSSTNPILRVRLAVAFADGHSAFIGLEDVQPTMEDCNGARNKMGLGALRPPPVIEDAMESATKP